MIKVNSIKFTDDYTGLPSGYGSDTGISRLMGYPGDFIYCAIDFTVEWSTLDTNIDFSSADKTITRKDCGLLSGSFITDGFKIGDTIVITGSSTNDGTYTITAVTSTTITVSQSLNTASDSGVNIYGTTTVNYFDFYYNLVGTKDAQNFKSLTDSKAVQRFSGAANPYYYGATFSLQPNSTSRAWWNNTVDGISSVPVFTDYGLTADYKQHFTILFPFLITPLFKADQLQILKNAYEQSQGSLLNDVDFDTASYFESLDSLKFIYQIDAKFNITNTAVDHSSAPLTTFEDGNTGWYNTFFPSGVYLNGSLLVKQQYDLVSIAYDDGASTALNSIDVNNPTDVTVIIERTGAASITNQKFVVNFMWLPTNISKYQGYSQNNQADFRQVFLHDRCKSSVGAASKNGDQYGTSVQALKSVVGTAIDANNFKVEFTIDLGSLSQSTFEADGTQNRNYLIWITPQSPDSTSIDEANRSAVLCDVNQAFLDTDDATLLTVTTGGTTDTHYFKYPDTYINPTTDFKGFVGEYGLLRNNFKVKTGCVIENVSVTTQVLVLNKETLDIVETMTLNNWTKQTGQYFNGTFTDFSLKDSNGYALPSGDVRNIRQVKRTPNMDVSGYYTYEINFGFQLGFQYWQNIVEFPDALSAFHNQYWAVYTQQGKGAVSNARKKSQDWIVVTPTRLLQIVHKIVWNIRDTSTAASIGALGGGSGEGIVTEFIQYSPVYAYDNISNISGNLIRIDTQNELGESLGGIVAKDSPTVVVATLSGNFTIPADSTEAIGELAAYYSDGNNNIYDAINTLDTDIETPNSAWTELPILIWDADMANGLLMAKLDLSGKPNAVRNIILYAKISYKTDQGLVTSTSQVQITDDNGTDLTPTLTT